MQKLEKELKDGYYGIDYTVNAIKSMNKSKESFSNIKQLIIKCNEILSNKQRDDQENNVNKFSHKDSKKSTFQRFSGSFDVPSILSHLPSSPSTSTIASSLNRSESAANSPAS
jgi:hypothetical protein